MLARWLAPEHLKWLIPSLVVPLTLAYMSQQYQQAQTDRQAIEARTRLYTELLSKREEADTGVRRGIFDRVLETYLKPGAGELPTRIVALELLAANFNESLDLSPLFWQLDRDVSRLPGEERLVLLPQLQRIAREIKDRQVELLEVVGAKRDATVDLEDLASSGSLIDDELVFPDPDPFAKPGRQVRRRFKIDVAEHDAHGRRIWARVSSGDRQWGFWIDQFDFPLVNFTRISTNERFTVVLRRYAPPSAQLTLVYFPSSRSGVKDKPFIDEVISDLVRRGDAR